MPGQSEDLAWIRLEDASAIGTARRAAADAARRVGFGDDRIAEVGLVATELATNAVVHASAGSVLTRIRRWESLAAIELLAVDSGPGIGDVEAMFEDGVSTRGTLGVGLGTLRRLANRVEIYSRPEFGSIVHCTFASNAQQAVPAIRLDGLLRPITGETVCGDAWAAVEDGDRIALFAADGLGHGELAAIAARAAIEAFHEDPWSGPAATITRAHQRIGHTRGAAVLTLDLDLAAGTVRWCGVGNVIGRMAGFDGSRVLSSQPGIVGHRLGRLREDTMAIDPHAAIVVHSDGLTNKWDLAAVPGLLSYSSTAIAAFLLRSAGVRHDDASVMVVKARP